MLGSQTEEQDISAEDIVLDLNPCPCPGSQQSPIISPLDVKGHGAWHLGPVTLLVASKMRRTSLRVTPGSCWPGLLHIITFIIVIIIIIIRTMYVTQRHNVSTYRKYKCWRSIWQCSGHQAVLSRESTGRADEMQIHCPLSLFHRIEDCSDMAMAISFSLHSTTTAIKLYYFNSDWVNKYTGSMLVKYIELCNESVSWNQVRSEVL